ncbi:MAG: putative collagen-binding domain-containing protein [Blastocatellia bacterium]
MKHLRRLIESRPYLSRVPDDGTVLNSPPGEKETRVQVTRGQDRHWAMYYITSGQAITPNLLDLKGPRINAWWFNPRDGQTYDNAGKPTDKPFGQFDNTVKKVIFDPPRRAGEAGAGNDWVLVLDNAAKGYSPPGKL